MQVKMEYKNNAISDLAGFEVKEMQGLAFNTDVNPLYSYSLDWYDASQVDADQVEIYGDGLRNNAGSGIFPTTKAAVEANVASFLRYFLKVGAKLSDDRNNLNPITIPSNANVSGVLSYSNGALSVFDQKPGVLAVRFPPTYRIGVASRTAVALGGIGSSGDKYTFSSPGQQIKIESTLSYACFNVPSSITCPSLSVGSSQEASGLSAELGEYSLFLFSFWRMYCVDSSGTKCTEVGIPPGDYTANVSVSFLL